ncbi:MAG: dynamin family protein [Negativicutes bacterium]|nr:dynamin family protein [Negativicutes bacterium]
MYNSPIDTTCQEVIRLLKEQRHTLLEELLATANLLKSQRLDQQQRTLNREDIERWLEVLKGEEYKVERLEVTFAVVGTMKAGKSTTINAIVGAEVLPNRNQPMTTLPTVIRHVPGKREPELTFPNPGPFNELIARLRDELSSKRQSGRLKEVAFCATDDGKELADRLLNGSLAEIRRTYRGHEEIYRFLQCINDIWRLGSSEGIDIDIDAYLEEYNEIHEFPVIEVEFFHLKELGNGHDYGRFTLIDTPGPNEAGQPCLKRIMHEQLKQASAVLAVLDYTQLNAEAEAEVLKAFAEITGLNDNRLFILVNKFDQKDRHGMDCDALRAYVAQHLFDGHLAPERVHPVSSKYGYLANRALCELSLSGRLPDYQFNPWVEDFGKLALGACWESEIEDSEEVRCRAGKLWRNSLFEKPLNDVIKKGCENSALISLKSAAAKMLDYDKKIVEGLQIRQTAINTDIKVVEEHIRSLEEDIRSIKDAKEDARRQIDASIASLRMTIHDLFAGCENVAKREIQTIFTSEQGNNWITQRLQGFIGPSPKRALSVEFDPKGYNDFATEAEAKQFLNRLIEAVAGHIEPILEDMQQTTQKTVDDMSFRIWKGIGSRLEKVLKAAEARLNETFAVTPEFPKPKVRSVAIDFGQLRQSAVCQDTVTKTATRQERRWYTLWCHKHTTTYEYQEQVYRIYTREIANQLQNLLEEDHSKIRAVLDYYVQNEFSQAINKYFTEITNYLERFKGDLLDSKRDQELESSRLEKLQAAMHNLLRIAVNHRRDVQAIEENLPGIASQDRPELVKTAG